MDNPALDVVSLDSESQGQSNNSADAIEIIRVLWGMEMVLGRTTLEEKIQVQQIKKTII